MAKGDSVTVTKGPQLIVEERKRGDRADVVRTFRFLSARVVACIEERKDEEDEPMSSAEQRRLQLIDDLRRT